MMEYLIVATDTRKVYLKVDRDGDIEISELFAQGILWTSESISLSKEELQAILKYL